MSIKLGFFSIREPYRACHTVHFQIWKHINGFGIIHICLQCKMTWPKRRPSATYPSECIPRTEASCCHLSFSSYCTSSIVLDYMVSMPTHGAAIGSWLGAWPMPLDWESGRDQGR